MSKLKKIILAAVLLAVAIVLNRFLSIKTSILTISFTFLPLILAGMFLGPIYSTLIAALTDLIGALLFPFGAYFVGYTISSAISGLTYGLLLYKAHEFSRKKLLIRLTIAVAIVIVFCNVFLNTIWILITMKKALFATLPIRLLKNLIMFPIEVAVIYFINIAFKKMGLYSWLFKNRFESEDAEDTAEPKTEESKVKKSKKETA